MEVAPANRSFLLDEQVVAWDHLILVVDFIRKRNARRRIKVSLEKDLDTHFATEF